MRIAAILVLTLTVAGAFAPQAEPTYAERLGWPEGTRAVIFHVDDAGMCLDANAGAIEAVAGLATS
ncbi:MAG TPA: hypothetical protein ENN80_03330, partial [Candidatus Hydrogenedentes bacterium]|nr:hypothetical protein [Candidatus Hydrogenedentota bacterium]